MCVAEDPAAVAAVGVHALSAEVAAAARGHAGNDDLVPDVKLRDARPDLFDDADALVAEDAALGHGREISLEDVKVGSADRRRRDPDDRVGRILEAGARTLLPRGLAGAVVDERPHRGFGGRGGGLCGLEFKGGAHDGHHLARVERASNRCFRWNREAGAMELVAARRSLRRLGLDVTNDWTRARGKRDHRLSVGARSPRPMASRSVIGHAGQFRSAL